MGRSGRGDKKRPWERLVARPPVCSRAGSLGGGGEVEAAALVELHVPHTAHGLDLRLEGAKLVVVSVVAALKQVLVTSVAGVLVAHPAVERQNSLVKRYKGTVHLGTKITYFIPACTHQILVLLVYLL